jgi:hypothetical protein
LKQHPEPEAGFMLLRQTSLPAYNVQIAVDAEHALIVAHSVVLDASDIRCLRPMAEDAKKAIELDRFKVVADAGYSNREQIAHCEATGMMPYVPVMRTVNNQGDGSLFGREDFHYEAETDNPTACCRVPNVVKGEVLHARRFERTQEPVPHFVEQLTIAVGAERGGIHLACRSTGNRCFRSYARDERQTTVDPDDRACSGESETEANEGQRRRRLL